MVVAASSRKDPCWVWRERKRPYYMIPAVVLYETRWTKWVRGADVMDIKGQQRSICNYRMQLANQDASVQPARRANLMSELLFIPVGSNICLAHPLVSLTNFGVSACAWDSVIYTWIDRRGRACTRRLRVSAHHQSIKKFLLARYMHAAVVPTWPLSST
jgi:hypothetical protein